MINRVYVEKKEAFAREGASLLQELRASLRNESVSNLRVLQRYDVEGLSEAEFQQACETVFAEAQVDGFTLELDLSGSETAFAVEFLPGQFDQRADSAAQCLKILTGNDSSVVAHAKVYVLEGSVSSSELEAIKQYVINPVDSREASMEARKSLIKEAGTPADVAVLEGFTSASEDQLATMASEFGLAMPLVDLVHIQKQFRDTEDRDPTITELKMLDTYWSDHCRHTTFLTALDHIEFAEGCPPSFAAAYDSYKEAREVVYGADTQRPETMMDMACIAMKELRKTGELDNLEVSEEINAASIEVEIEIDGKPEAYLVMFKNETHNHPTEIEPFGGAATCLGGAIRDPLSGRSYVYQAMRVTGAADPTVPYSETMPGKLPQKKICVEASEGYSSYGNQIGLATGSVAEVYHPNFVAKRMEIGAVVAAAPKKNVFRGAPATGDVILLMGGRTGRDGVGGATGSSKEHTETALDNSAEVQKGNPPVERALQRLFRNPVLAPKIKICNDFGAGGVSVAIGELAPSLQIDLDQVRKKYDGLDGTEIAISESQERMAVIVDPSDVDYFIAEADKENLECYKVADVTDTGRLVMTWRGKVIVDLEREFLDTNGVQQTAQAKLHPPVAADSPLGKVSTELDFCDQSSFSEKFLTLAGNLNFASQKGLMERFDGTIGAGSVLHPLGGQTQLTPTDAMVAKIPVLNGETDAATYMSWGYNPRLASWSPFHGAAYALTQSVCRIVSAGAQLSDIRLTLQEYFEKLGNDKSRWGKPVAALLGALHVQRSLRLGAIGGKDSMSGTFKDIDVPPTLVSFALAPGLASNAISPEFKQADSNLYLIETPRAEDGLPQFDQLMKIASELHELIASGKILAAHSLGEGGIAEGLMKMSLGNHIGAKVTEANVFTEKYASFLIECEGELPASLNAQLIGQTTDDVTLEVAGESVLLAELESAYLGKLEGVYPNQAPSLGLVSKEVATISSEVAPVVTKSSQPTAKPRVIIPVFPGSNCEYDTAKAFEKAGAEAETLVFRNLTASAVEESLDAFAKQIDNSQILMIPGGFSAGDEPDGSGKFIAAVLRNERVKDAIHRLLHERDGLALGICNGFQALIKTGLLPHGEIKASTPQDPTLTYNTIGRHVARYAETRISSTKSPWLSKTAVGDIHNIAFSHGEGRFMASPETMEALIANGQIATQYVDNSGEASMDISANPNGSVFAVEGICSPDGKVFGKMGHTEREGANLAKNIAGNKYQALFEGGVEYFV